MSQFISRLVGATRKFERGPNSVTAVDRANISISQGEMVGIMGPSASGKTTLLNLIGMLETPTSGEVFFEDLKISELSAAERRKQRLTKVGFVFQQLKLIPVLSALENVELPLALSHKPADYQRKMAAELLEAVGLAGKENLRPAKLSVGEQQRIAVARALANDPVLVLADEPTSQLDSASGRKVIDLLSALRKRSNAAVVISTHDASFSKDLERVYQMRDGVLAAQ